MNWEVIKEVRLCVSRSNFEIDIWNIAEHEACSQEYKQSVLNNDSVTFHEIDHCLLLSKEIKDL